MSEQANSKDCSKLPADWSAAFGVHGYDNERIAERLDRAYAETDDVYPPKRDVLRAFHATRLADVRAVILGQDPYYDAPGKAHGLAFSVPTGVDVPRSLRAIFRALAADIPGSVDPEREDGDLTRWASEQGVLLLNRALTVRANHPKSHLGLWSRFTDLTLQILRDRSEPIAFMTWGVPAIRQAHRLLLSSAPHAVFEAAHPRFGAKRAGRSFGEAKPFGAATVFLRGTPRGAIDWRLADSSGSFLTSEGSSS